MGEKIKNIFRGPIISSVFYIALGLTLALLPVESISIICKVVFGVVMVLAGVYHIIILLFERNSATIMDLFSGVILTVFGVFLFMNPLIVVKLLPTLLGTFVLVDSLWTLKDSFRLKKLKSGSWKVLLGLCVIFIGLGVTLIINPFKVVKYTIVFAGITLVLNGMADLIFLVMIRVAVKKAEKQEALQNEENAGLEQPTNSDAVQKEESVYEDWNSHIESENSDMDMLDGKTEVNGMAVGTTWDENESDISVRDTIDQTWDENMQLPEYSEEVQVQRDEKVEAESWNEDGEEMNV